MCTDLPIVRFFGLTFGGHINASSFYVVYFIAYNPREQLKSTGYKILRL